MKNQRKQRLLSAILAAVLTVSLLPSGITAYANDQITTTKPTAEATGTPYDAEGNYDVETPHVIVNQVYGGSDDGAASHSFIELYNPCENDIDLKGWELQYRASEDGEDPVWHELTLTGTIPANGYYLIRCGATSGTDYTVPAGDQEWDIQIHNKGVSVALFSENVTLTDGFTGNVLDGTLPNGYVDLLAVHGNDEDDTQIPPAYEGEYEDIQSKKKAVRRDDFADTDNNANDASEIDYSDTVDEDKGPHNSKSETGGAGSTEPDTPPQETQRLDSFETDAALTMELLNSTNIGTANADGGVAEIVAYNADSKEAYVVNGQDGLLYRFSVTEGGLT